MGSPVYYILNAMLLASLTLSIIFFLAWKTLGKPPYALSWSIGFLGATMQWFFNLNQGWFSNHATYWVIVNAFALVLITLGIRGRCQYGVIWCDAGNSRWHGVTAGCGRRHHLL